ncbi:heat shock 22 kDa protein mitochondrial [Phtheirospermum japonicum]|uniref:Heat shock 22 kDa protein mitochondrial n=1 Tax=Phtheirospermum japonicum TaxID=374723 RepID=A0A830BFY9_9LAMI|nr:heat shock 22 kDa protein mitochondrial [Phtheirospermum japonicum]
MAASKLAQKPSYFISTSAAPLFDGHDRDFDDDCRPDLNLFSPVYDMLHLFSTGSSPSQALGMTYHDTGKWKTKQSAECLHMFMDMPGLGKEDIKVSVEKNTLMVKGEGKKVFDDDKKTMRGYNNKFDLPKNVYKTNEIKAEMKNEVVKKFDLPENVYKTNEIKAEMKNKVVKVFGLRSRMKRGLMCSM